MKTTIFYDENLAATAEQKWDNSKSNDFSELTFKIERLKCNSMFILAKIAAKAKQSEFQIQTQIIT